ncbi:MAG: energy transducer TonB, partial [Gelidibacter sp.]|nr:energy transducer TonB [Gelidibacter sp.]
EEEIPITTVKTPIPPGTQIAITSDAIKIVDDFREVEESFIGSSETNQMDVMGKVTENGGAQPVLKIDDIKVEDVEEDIEVPFAVIESVPVFPGCEKGTKEEKKACFQNKMLEHVKNNFKYPKIAQEMGIYGRVIVLFVIDKDGRVINIQSRGPDKILEKEAERIIGLLPKMIPGKQRGKPVKVTYSLPIYFKYVER